MRDGLEVGQTEGLEDRPLVVLGELIGEIDEIGRGRDGADLAGRDRDVVEQRLAPRARDRRPVADRLGDEEDVPVGPVAAAGVRAQDRAERRRELAAAAKRNGEPPTPLQRLRLGLDNELRQRLAAS